MKKDKGEVYTDISGEIIRTLSKSDVPEHLLHIIQGWLVSEDTGGDKDRVLRELYDEVFQFRTRPSQDAYELLPLIMERIGIKETYTKPVRQKNRPWLRIAAVVVPLMIVAGATLFIITGDKKGAAVPEPAYTYITPMENGDGKYILPCGSEIWLKEGSRAWYSAAHYNDERSVGLDGEAYFSVSALPGKTFRVVAPDLDITVLGTRFNVDSHSGGATAAVSLFSGSLLVNTADASVKLAPKERLTYNVAEGSSVVEGFDPAAIENWRGSLELNNVSVDEAMRLVSEHFDMPVVVRGSSAARQSLRGRFSNESMREVLDMLTLTGGGFHYEIVSDTVYVYKR